jgi:membrane-bound serine protease (ClpP class)
MDLEDPAFTLVPLVLVAAALGVFGLLAGLRAQRARPVSGPEGLLGMRGVALSKIVPHVKGQVFVRGEIWEALPAEGARAIEAEETVEVVRLEGLTARVAPAEAP